MPMMPSLSAEMLELTGMHLASPPRKSSLTRRLVRPSTQGSIASLGGASCVSLGSPKAAEDSRPDSRGSVGSSVPILRRPRQQLLYQVRSPELLLPAWGTSNDMARIRNNGKPLQPRLLPTSPMLQGLQASASSPSLSRPSRAQASLPPRAWSPREQVPKLRLPSGTLGLVSRVAIQYEVNPLNDSRVKRSPRWHIPAECSPRRFKQREKTESQEVEEKLPWLPLPELEQIAGLTTSVSINKHEPTISLKRSMHLMDGLYALRRLNKGDPDRIRGSRSPSPSPRNEGDLEAGPSVETVPEDLDLQASADEALPKETSRKFKRNESIEGMEDDPLLPATLKDLDDTSETLRKKEAGITRAQVLVLACHGKRHPTNVLSERVLQVIRRKMGLLEKIEARFAAFQAAHARREEILRSIVDAGEEAPDELLGVREFCRKFVHRPGRPVDADRSLFDQFVATFKLEAKHGLLEKFRRRGAEAGGWWAEQTELEAVKGADHVAIKTLISTSVSMGCDAAHPMLLRANEVLLDRIASHCIKFAQEMKERDKMAEEKATQRGQILAVGLSSAMADKVDEEIFKAVSGGVNKDEPRIKEAESIALELREADNTRKRLHAREARLKEEAKAAKS
eukprot:TRINITY_DN18050_c0_g2_i1.p1 TRINITY_DN18050_c0_g2~~TRINITY_DN18050_c0_g2_i1.p1  ORF type:complete len:658 (+),score=124.75 TRINITY_DN18050_c0_g2_i1:103-1974(+)